jgi:hypothetical protein
MSTLPVVTPKKVRSRAATGSGITLAGAANVPQRQEQQSGTPTVPFLGPDDSGISLGTAIGGAGADMMAAEARTQAKVDSVTAGEAITELDVNLAAFHRDALNDPNISKEGFSEAFSEKVNDEFERISGAIQSPGAQHLFQKNGEIKRRDYLSSIGGDIAIATNDAQENLTTKTYNGIGADVLNGLSFEEGLMLAEAALELYSPGRSDDEIADKRFEGEGIVAAAEFEKMFAAASSDPKNSEAMYDKALAFAARPDVKGLIDPLKHIEMKTRVLSRKAKANAFQKGVDERTAYFEKWMGRPAVGKERLALAKISIPEGPQTVAAKVAEINTALAAATPPGKTPKTVTPEMILKMQGAAGETNKPPKAAWEDHTFIELGPLVSTGTATSKQTATFMTAVQSRLNEAREFKDPDTDLMMSQGGVLSVVAMDALVSSGLVNRFPELRGSLESTISNESEPAPTPKNDLPPELRDLPKFQGMPTRADPLGSIFFHAQKIAGVIPAAIDFGANIPGVGELFQGDTTAQIQQIRSSYKAHNTALNAAMTVNDNRFLKAETEIIREEVAVKMKKMTNPTSFQNETIGLDDFLALRYEKIGQIASSPKVGKEERQQANNVLIAIDSYRESLGVPPKVFSLQEFNALPKGYWFRKPSGGAPLKKLTERTR